MKTYPRIQKATDSMLDKIIDADPKTARELTMKLFKRLVREPNRRKLTRKAYLSTMKPAEPK
jgi:hypothetical protein